MEKDVYTIPEAAGICSVGRTTMWRWVKSGELKASATLGGKYRISKTDLKDFILKNDIHSLTRKLSYGKKILIVDDDPGVQTILKTILSTEKYETDIAADGFEAGVKVMAFNPDLIILDLFMPGMDGFEVCERMKKNSNTSHIKILAITGYDTRENTERVLFIDDEPAIMKLGRQTLRSLGYEVTTRTSSLEALELFKKKRDRFDLVITDMTMPHMTGDKLAEELMKIRLDIPVILCTGFSSRIDEQKALDIGIRAFITKPFLKREIAEAIRKVLNGKEEH